MLLSQIKLNNVREIIKAAVDEADKDTLSELLFILVYRGDLDVRLERIARQEDSNG